MQAYEYLHAKWKLKICKMIFCSTTYPFHTHLHSFALKENWNNGKTILESGERQQQQQQRGKQYVDEHILQHNKAPNTILNKIVQKTRMKPQNVLSFGLWNIFLFSVF